MIVFLFYVVGTVIWNIISHTHDRHVITTREMNDVLTCTIYIWVHPSGSVLPWFTMSSWVHSATHAHAHIISYHITSHHTTPHHIIYVCVCAHVLAVFAYVCKARAPLMIHGLLEAQFSSKWWIIVNVYWCMVYLWFGTFISKSKQHLIFSECWHCVGCVCPWLGNAIQSHFNVSGGYVQLKMSNNYLWFITSLWLLLLHAYSPDQKYSQ